MLGTSRLWVFALRALLLLLLVSMLWISVARSYNSALASLAKPLLPDGVSIRVLGSHLLFESPGLASPVSVDGLTLHFGLVLMVVLVLAAVDISVVPRLAWLLGMVGGAFLAHVAGVALLGRGMAWAAASNSPADSWRLLFSLFALFWGLLPALCGGVWCFAYWVPRVSRPLAQARRGQDPPPERGDYAKRGTNTEA